jgi:hypothetical protein
MIENISIVKTVDAPRDKKGLARSASSARRSVRLRMRLAGELFW